MLRRILLLTLSTTLLVVLAFAIPLAVLIGRETVQRAEADLQSQAQSTAFDAARGSATPTSVQTYIAAADRTNSTSTLVQFADGTTIGSLPGAAQAVVGRGGFPSDGGGSPPPGRPGGQLQDVPGGGRLAAGFNRDSGAAVFVYASADTLSSGADGWYALLGGGSAALLVLAAAAAVVVSRRISAPLSATADAAHRLSVGEIDARAPVAGPREVAEVGSALNRLAGRIDELIGEERETVADLSHRMRTPLTALRLDADGLRDTTEAERIGEHVTTLERTLTGVIRAARRAEREGLVPACDATAVVAERTDFWSALAEDQGRSFVRSLPSEPVVVRAAAGDLAAAVDALVENVLAHTPEGVGFRVDLYATGAGGETGDDGGTAAGGVAELVVTDEGPGIPHGAGERGRSDRGSTGLGLSIAARCAENSGGSFTIERPPGGGGVVRLRLGRP